MNSKASSLFVYRFAGKVRRAANNDMNRMFLSSIIGISIFFAIASMLGSASTTPISEQSHISISMPN
jgi:ABC-type transporter lipoprotein component MlaA